MSAWEAVAPDGTTWEPIGSIKGNPGPPGPPGPPALFLAHHQTEPAYTWLIDLPPDLGRYPVIAVYVDGAQVLADATCVDGTVQIEWPTPTVGHAVIT